MSQKTKNPRRLPNIPSRRNPARGVPQADGAQPELAKALHVPPRRINEMVLGKRAVSADTALRLARYFGMTDTFWLGLKIDYDIEEARRAAAVRIEREIVARRKAA